MLLSRPLWNHLPLLGLVCLLSWGHPLQAQETKSDKQLAKGDYLFKAGYFLKASEHYRLALLEDPSSPWKKLAFGHSLFAIGNYSYSNYALRRGVSELDKKQPFRPEIASLFPSRRAFVQALRDLKRYVTYSPRDPAGLSALGYVLFSIDGEEKRCRDMFRYLKKLDKNDPFTNFFLAQLSRRSKQSSTAKVKPRSKVPEAPASPPSRTRKSTKGAPLKKAIPEPKRQKEKAKTEWPKPIPAPAK